MEKKKKVEMKCQWTHSSFTHGVYSIACSGLNRFAAQTAAPDFGLYNLLNSVLR